MTPAQHLAEACRVRFLRVEDVRGKSRSTSMARARREIAAVMHAAGCSSVEIGRELGRDHSTILYLLGRTAAAKARAARKGAA